MKKEVCDWLKKGVVTPDEGEHERRLRAAAEKCFGAIEGRNPRRAETARRLVRARLRISGVAEPRPKEAGCKKRRSAPSVRTGFYYFQAE